MKLLEQVPLFQDCSKDERAKAAHLAEELRVEDGHNLVREGTAGHTFLVIVEGEADVLQGGERIGSMGRFEHLGEVSLVAQTRRTATVVARGPVRALAFDEDAFRRLLDIPSVRSKVGESAIERLAGHAHDDPAGD